MYASAQALDFLAITKNPSFPDRKLQVSHPVFPDGHELMNSGSGGIEGLKRLKLPEFFNCCNSFLIGQ